MGISQNSNQESNLTKKTEVSQNSNQESNLTKMEISQNSNQESNLTKKWKYHKIVIKNQI